jgi:8-oxo-dGTP pyrophosphatase MutT (NUDIX family)
MRRSTASLAVIRRPGPDGRPLYLAQWNEKWKSFNLVGGHKKENESFRACLVRELFEELGIVPEPGDPDGLAGPGPTCLVGKAPLGRLDYEAFSQSAGERSSYCIELFGVDLSPQAEEDISRDQNNRWVSEAEIEAGRCADGKAVSDTMRHHWGWLRRHEKASGACVVLWTYRARRVLRRCLPDPDADAAPYQDHLCRVLRDTFPHCSIVVQDVMTGFRPRSDWFILLVEVMTADGAPLGANVVKVAGRPSPAGDEARDELCKELAAWQRCAPPGLKQDLVFLPLDRGFPRAPDQPPESILYGDAHQFIGAAITHALEEAVTRSVQFGFPLAASVLDVITQLFERAGYLFYYAGREDGPPDPARQPPRQPAYRFDVPRLAEALKRWQTDQDLLRVRIEVDNLITRIEHRVGEQDERLYLGPVPYLKTVADIVPVVDPEDICDRAAVPVVNPAAPSEKPAAPISGDNLSLSAPRAIDVVPGMLRGPAHGDLHGRNVLVGVVRDRACWPAVFDYGDMGPRNFIGWDFVKLETELKVRLYEKVFATPSEATFARDVQRFEIELAQKTEKHRHDNDWPAGPAEASEQARLRAVLLRIRQMAAVHLGENPGRPHRWLEEYYFLMMCYGVVAGRFDNYTRRQRIAVLVSSGTAAARLSWPRRRFEEEMRLVHAAVSLGDKALDASALVLLRDDSIGYDAPLALANHWRRSGNQDLVQKAVEWLVKLKGRFSSSLDVRQELILALLSAGDQPRAITELRAAQALLRNPNEEVLCRWGRLLKNEGDKLRDSDAKAADEYYRLSANQYQEAYAIRNGHYPGINLAALLLIRAALARQRQSGEAEPLLARLESSVKELLDRRKDWPTDYGEQDRKVWHPATEAEANLLRKEWKRAAGLYQSITSAQEGEIAVMKQQVERILDAWRKLGVTDFESFNDPAQVFPPHPAQALQGRPEGSQVQ